MRSTLPYVLDFVLAQVAIDRSPEFLDRIVDIAQVVATVVAAAAVYLTYRTLREMETQRMESIKPRLDIIRSKEGGPYDRLIHKPQLTKPPESQKTDSEGGSYATDGTFTVTVKNTGEGTAWPVWVILKCRDLDYQTCEIPSIIKNEEVPVDLQIVRYRSSRLRWHGIPFGHRTFLSMPNETRRIPEDALLAVNPHAALLLIYRDYVGRWWKTTIPVRFDITESDSVQPAQITQFMECGNPLMRKVRRFERLRQERRLPSRRRS